MTSFSIQPDLVAIVLVLLVSVSSDLVASVDSSAEFYSFEVVNTTIARSRRDFCVLETIRCLSQQVSIKSHQFERFIWRLERF